MDLTKVKEGLKSFINENTRQEEVEKIGELVNEIEKAETEEKELIEKHEALRIKYVEAVKNSAFKDNPSPKQDDTPKSFEECINDTISKRK